MRNYLRSLDSRFLNRPKLPGMYPSFRAFLKKINYFSTFHDYQSLASEGSSSGYTIFSCSYFPFSASLSSFSSLSSRSRACVWLAGSFPWSSFIFLAFTMTLSTTRGWIAVYSTKLPLKINDVVLLLNGSEAGHLSKCHQKQHSFSIVWRDFFNLYLIEDTSAINEILFRVSLEHLISKSVWLEELRRVFNCVECQGNRYFIGIFKRLIIIVNEIYLESKIN